MEKWKIKLENEEFICDNWSYDEKLKYIVLENVYSRDTIRHCVDDRIKTVDSNNIEIINKKDKLYKFNIFIKTDPFKYTHDVYNCKTLQFEFKDVVSIALLDNFSYITKEDSIQRIVDNRKKLLDESIVNEYNYIINRIIVNKANIKKSFPLTQAEKDTILDRLKWLCGYDKLDKSFEIIVDKNKVTVGEIE